MHNSKSTRRSVVLFCIAFFAYGLMFTAGLYNKNATSSHRLIHFTCGPREPLYRRFRPLDP